MSKYLLVIAVALVDHRTNKFTNQGMPLGWEVIFRATIGAIIALFVAGIESSEIRL